MQASAGGSFAVNLLHMPGCLQTPGLAHSRLCGVKILHVIVSSPTMFFLCHVRLRSMCRFCFWHGV